MARRLSGHYRPRALCRSEVCLTCCQVKIFHNSEREGAPPRLLLHRRAPGVQDTNNCSQQVRDCYLLVVGTPLTSKYEDTEIGRGLSTLRDSRARSRTGSPTASPCSAGASSSWGSECWSVSSWSSYSFWWTGEGGQPEQI